jgi:phospholipid-binding lipoprotein MlaA
MSKRRFALPFAFALAGAVCVAGSPAGAQENDPLERVNRAVFEFNRVVDALILEPVSILYGDVVPELGRRGVRNFLDNLRAPVIFVNDVLQGERDRAGVTIGRFFTNTIFGLGLFDVAADFGHDKHDEDFGQTLAVWGIGDGPYLVLPLLGPSNARDLTGIAVDGFVIDPFGTILPTGTEVPIGARVARTATDAVDWRHRLAPAIDDIYRNSLDPYATFRTVYRQRRAAEIRNRQPDAQAQQDYEDIFQEDLDAE